MRDNYRWWTTIGTRWADCDAYGHINDVTNYSCFDAGVTRMRSERGVLGVGAEATGLCVESAYRMGLTSACYPVAIFPTGGDEPAATGHFTHVIVDRATRRSVAIAPPNREAPADLVTGETP